MSVCSCTSWTATPQDILSLPTILSSMAVICLWMRQHCCPNPQTIDSRCVYTPFRHSTFCFLPSPNLGTGRDPIQQTNHQTQKKTWKTHWKTEIPTSSSPRQTRSTLYLSFCVFTTFQSCRLVSVHINTRPRPKHDSDYHLATIFSSALTHAMSFTHIHCEAMPNALICDAQKKNAQADDAYAP